MLRQNREACCAITISAYQRATGSSPRTASHLADASAPSVRRLLGFCPLMPCDSPYYGSFGSRRLCDFARVPACHSRSEAVASPRSVRLDPSGRAATTRERAPARQPRSALRADLQLACELIAPLA